MFTIGQIITQEELKKYIRSLAYIDEDILEMYTNIFSKYICKKISILNLDYSWINTDEEMAIVCEYANDISDMPPILVSPSFDGKRIVYDGCHRCAALEMVHAEEVIAFVPYLTKDGRLVEDMENRNLELSYCKYGECNKGKCCMVCDYNGECGNLCSYCFELGVAHQIIKKNVSLFCDGIWK